MRSSRFLTALLLTSTAASMGFMGGCDTIRARSRAQDGVQLYKDGEPAKAAGKFEEAQKLDPTIPTVWLNLGFADLAVYQANTRAIGGALAATRAIFAFEKYLEMRPKEERATSYLVQTFVDTGRYDDAVKFFQPVVDRTPPDAEVTQALATLGTIASKVGRYEDAVIWYERRIKADPDNGDARLALGIQMWDRLKNHIEIVGKDRVELANKALATLKEARRLSPQAPNPYLYTNLVYRERANAALGDDPKNADLTLAGDYFQMANEVGKKDEKGVPEKKALADFEKHKADAAVNEPKADALVAAAVAALPPPVDLNGPNAPTAPPVKAPKKKGKK